MSLDRAAIVDAALALLEADGIEGLSTRKLAQALNIKGPSLYWHFKNKRELLEQMTERLYEDALPKPPGHDLRGFDRRAWLEAGARGLRRVALSHRDGALLLAGSRPARRGGTKNYESMLATLQRSGLSLSDGVVVLQVLGRFAVGWVLYEQTSGRSLEDSEIGFEFGLQSLLDGVENRMASHQPPETLSASA